MKNNQSGSLDPLMIPLIVSVILVLSLATFGIWAYLSYLEANTNLEEKIAVAVADAEVVQKEALESEFAEREKSPFTTWRSASTIGSIELTYPKTWSAYIDENEGSSNPLNGFFNPKFVSADERESQYALGITVDESNYTSEIESFENDITSGTVEAKAVELKDGVTGVRFVGEISNDYNGAIVIFPLRDKTVKIWTESRGFIEDFDKVIETLEFDK